MFDAQSDGLSSPLAFVTNRFLPKHIQTATNSRHCKISFLLFDCPQLISLLLLL
ncbi:hypothetical protein P175DRAFT_0501653 [Aspergillus ochraceoroseus IBT 24754]|uniref:Uncharacterized protein n=1 Tax=Aspergillus ochraceoroseus IBT 24754 TaxID=1392256 RepID=A0A2T5LXQ1_9EURO|nr:uncharacterized protein P175DRAFT_0501653 [Aspergillus ochraceoroseus IBT 24754]PTU21023.1 hypothetical protein P175DRAFT_0501653 [Aspergillus ochraceoroseus IBT 24754]